MSIVVVTDNGELYGRRFGYVVDSGNGKYWIPVGTSQLIPLQAPKPKEPEVFWRDLEKTSWRDEECSYCDYSPNPTIMMNTTDCGRRRVVRCRRCSMIMRPYNS